MFEIECRCFSFTRPFSFRLLCFVLRCLFDFFSFSTFILLFVLPEIFGRYIPEKLFILLGY